MNSTHPTALLCDAAATIRSHPLRWSETDSGAPIAEVVERGWFRDPGECSRFLSSFLATDIESGHAFGGSWPVLVSGEWWVAPAMPVAVGPGAVQGVDGEYRRRRRMVWRETAGAEEPYLSVNESANPPGRPFDLLWFGDSERFTVRDSTLVVEDLFSVLRVGADQALLEKLVVRGLRHQPEVLVGIEFANSAREAQIEVRRPEAVTVGKKWQDPAALLAVRADVRSLEQHTHQVVVETVHGNKAVFAPQATPFGWRLQLIDGSYVFSELSLSLQEDVVSLSATVDPSIDPLAPGMRGRLAFDLRADLVALD